MKPIKDKLYWLYPEGTVPNSIIDYTLEQLKDKERQAGRIGKGKNDDRATNIVKLDTPKGGILVFPTFLMHAVKPIVSGKRISCVGWITGPMLK